MNTPVTHPQSEIRPLLSICIPTYNRAPYLEYLLEKAMETWTLSFSYEIVISNNASSDHTDDVVQKYIDRGLPIRYFRQPCNKGGGPNGMTVLHRARGEYIVYIGDDDLFHIEGLEMAMAYLQSRPELEALYAPWESYDAVKDEKTGQFFTLEADVTFNPGQQLEMLGFIVRHHIFPEHMIYRADTVRVILLDPPFCYWAYVYLVHIATRGAVHFSKTPFYRSITNHPVAANRTQAGHEQAMTDWDTYRGGLEYFVYVLLKRQGVCLNEEGRKQIRILIDAFIESRMKVALRLWIQRGDYVCAYNLIARLNYTDPSKTAEIQDLRRLQILAAHQIIARFANGIAGVRRLVIVGDQDIDAKRAMLLSLGLREDFIVTADPNDGDAETCRGSVVIVSQEDDRQNAIRLGFEPGLIISDSDVFAGIHLI